MAVREKDKLADNAAPERIGPQSFLDRLNDFGERNAKLIITVSTLLIIVTVIIFANVLWQRSLFDRLERDLGNANSTDQLKAMQKKYSRSAAEPRVLAVLGHRYYEQHKLEEAIATYEEFLKRFQGHALSGSVSRSLHNINENLKFEKEKKDELMKLPLLDVNPLNSSKVAGHPLRSTPIKEEHPVISFKIKGKPDTIKIELFEDEAPNTVANFINLIHTKYVDGLTFQKINKDERLQIAAKKEGAVAYQLPFETTFREGDIGALVMIRAAEGGNNTGAEFQILLKSVADLKDATVFGRILSEEAPGMAPLRKIEETDVVESTKVERLRTNRKAEEYKPTVLPK